MSKKNQKKPLPERVIRGTSKAGMGGGAILLALALFLLFKGFGPGGTAASGSGTGEGSTKTHISKASVEGKTPEQNTEESLTAPDLIPGGLTDDEKKALSGDSLTVLIDEYEYMIELPGTKDPLYRPTELSRIVELATLTKGDPNGTRVRILIRESARASAEKQIQADLEHAGIHRDAIKLTSEFVP